MDLVKDSIALAAIDFLVESLVAAVLSHLDHTYLRLRNHVQALRALIN